MVENSDATSIVVTKIEPKRDGLAVLVRVKTKFGDFHLEIPVGVNDPTQALHEARKTLYRFFHEDLTRAADPPLQFE
jgi:hypothetical protein